MSFNVFFWCVVIFNAGQAVWCLNAAIEIINGHDATASSVPYLAYVKLQSGEEDWFCGGSLISQNYVLTSANCTYRAENFTVVLGAYDISSSNESTRQVFTGTRDSIIQHERYFADVFLNDIALIKLSQAAVINDAVQIIPLTSGGDPNLEGQNATISGWGTTDGFDEYPAVLLNGDVTVSNISVCEHIYIDLIQRDKQFCTINDDIGVSICDGDFGGPLAINGTLYGVQSFIIPYCYIGFPSVYTKLSFYLEWIAKNSDVSLQ
ncbi:chymotrypsin-like [Cylas formicarius]|uniref:chymotrypsin-like n=1 Tax=Cylas formicarius TaxID=197179 RepID=UPI0029585697|nr:chymotrypsin-like [Cylas formicarius]